MSSSSATVSTVRLPPLPGAILSCCLTVLRSPWIMTASSSQAVTVQYATADGSAVAGTDYAATGGTLTFSPGVLTQYLTVSVLGNTTAAADKTFSVVLSSPSNATVGVTQGVVTIKSPSQPPASPPPPVYIGDLTINKPTAGTTVATFAISLAAASNQTVTVNYATADGTALGGTDYTFTSGTLTFGPGVRTQLLSVTILSNILSKANDVFYVTLYSPSNATLGSSRGTVTIRDLALLGGTGSSGGTVGRIPPILRPAAVKAVMAAGLIK